MALVPGPHILRGYCVSEFRRDLIEARRRTQRAQSHQLRHHEVHVAHAMQNRRSPSTSIQFRCRLSSSRDNSGNASSRASGSVSHISTSDKRKLVDALTNRAVITGVIATSATAASQKL